MKILRALATAFTGFGWALAPPSGPYDFGFVVPVPHPEAVDSPSVPLSRQEREAFRRLAKGGPGPKNNVH